MAAPDFEGILWLKGHLDPHGGMCVAGIRSHNGTVARVVGLFGPGLPAAVKDVFPNVKFHGPLGFIPTETDDCLLMGLSDAGLHVVRIPTDGPIEELGPWPTPATVAVGWAVKGGVVAYGEGNATFTVPLDGDHASRRDGRPLGILLASFGSPSVEGGAVWFDPGHSAPEAILSPEGWPVREVVRAGEGGAALAYNLSPLSVRLSILSNLSKPAVTMRFSDAVGLAPGTPWSPPTPPLLLTALPNGRLIVAWPQGSPVTTGVEVVVVDAHNASVVSEQMLGNEPLLGLDDQIRDRPGFDPEHVRYVVVAPLDARVIDGHVLILLGSPKTFDAPAPSVLDLSSSGEPTCFDLQIGSRCFGLS